MKKIKKIVTKTVAWKYLPWVVISFFFVCYLTLGLVKHYTYQTGFDLAIATQAIYKYSRFDSPVITLHSYFDSSILRDHVELIYILIAPIFWVAKSAYVLLFIQALAVTVSGYAVYLLAKHYKLHTFLALCVLVSYLSFYGIQFALWSDFHSLVLALSFLAFFLYFLITEKFRWATVFFVLSIICKEDIALFTFGISLVQFIYTRDRRVLWFLAGSLGYLCVLFFVYYPYFTTGYRYAGSKGLFSNLDPFKMVDASEKQGTYLYSLLHFGFLPIFSPVALIPSLLDLAHYFLPGGERVAAAQGIFLHYRSTLALLLVWPTILTFKKLAKFNPYILGVYLILFALLSQYVLHLPLSYLTKAWFWQVPPAQESIDLAISTLPPDAALATQVNILPHVATRSEVYTLFPEKRQFDDLDICGKNECYTLRYAGSPEYIIVDVSPQWNTLHLLANSDEFKEGLATLKKTKKLDLISNNGTTYVYKVSP